MMDLHATGQFGFDPVNRVVRFAGKNPVLVGQEGGIVMTFQMLELAYLASRQIVLQSEGVQVQTLQQGGPSAPTNGHASVPRVGSPSLHTEH